MSSYDTDKISIRYRPLPFVSCVFDLELAVGLFIKQNILAKHRANFLQGIAAYKKSKYLFDGIIDFSDPFCSQFSLDFHFEHSTRIGAILFPIWRSLKFLEPI